MVVVAFVLDLADDESRLERWNSSGDGFDRTLQGVPGGLTITSSGVVVLAEPHGNRVRWLYRDGTSATVGGEPGFRDGPPGTGRFRSPRGVAATGDGAVIVADTGNHAIRRIDAEGTVVTLAGGISGWVDGRGAGARFFGPAAVAVTDPGTVIVADTVNNMIRRIDPEGEVTTLAGNMYGQGDLGAGLPSFRRPESVAAGGDGMVYVADTGNHRVCRIEPTGRVALVAGRPNGGDSDANGKIVGFHWPTGLSVAADGTIYLADSGNETIRRITTAGLSATIDTDSGWQPIATGVLDDDRVLVAETRWDPFAPTARLRTLKRS